MNEENKFFVDVFFIVMKDILEDNEILMRQGEVGIFIGNSDKNGYFTAKRLTTDEILDLPYAAGFIKIIGTDIPEEYEEFNL